MADFEEIAHSGGTITVRVVTDAEGRRGYQQSYSGSRPNAVAIISVWALPQGIPIAWANLGAGVGNSMGEPPIAGCYMVMIGSDSEGKFGHHCAACNGYWRSGPWCQVCPYCRFQDQPFNFLSDAQRRYVAHVCEALNEAFSLKNDNTVTIDMDAVADAAGKEGEKPAFYVSEERQQRRFNCNACNEFNDVIGRFAYCSLCATRNDAATFKSDVTAMRSRVSNDNTGNTVRDAVSAFDNIVGQYAKQLHSLVPLSKRRADRLERGRFHDLTETVEVVGWFDIDLLRGLSTADTDLLKRMFLRRHVYEHNGGEVDQIYIDKSGDNSVRIKQQLSEKIEDLHRFLGNLDRMVRNLHDGFQELLPPFEKPIRFYADQQARVKAYQEGRR